MDVLDDAMKDVLRDVLRDACLEEVAVEADGRVAMHVVAYVVGNAWLPDERSLDGDPLVLDGKTLGVGDHC